MGRLPIFIALAALATLPGASSAASWENEGVALADFSSGEAADFALLEPWTADGSIPLRPVWNGGGGRPLFGTFRIGAIFLTRDDPKAQPSARILSLDDNQPLFDGAEFGLGTRTGLDFTFLMAVSAINEIELRYFGIDDWAKSFVAADPSGVRFEGFGTTSIALADRVDYSSKLHSFELSIRPRVVDSVALLIGFRTVQLHERFTVAAIDLSPDSLVVDAGTHNFLYGFQIGAEPTLLGAGSPLRLEALIKAGIYGNRATAQTFSPIVGGTLDADRTRPSFVGELGLTAAYRFSRFFTIRGGYELLWLDGVAVAPDQSASVNLLAPHADIYSSTNLLYQGALVSLEFVF